MFDFAGFFCRAVMQSVPLLYGATGEIITEKSGNLNLGIPGIMYAGGAFGMYGAKIYEHAVGAENLAWFPAFIIPVLSAMIGAALMAFIYCFLTITLHANQNVTGLALTTFGVGLGNLLGSVNVAKAFGIIPADSTVPGIALKNVADVFRVRLPFAEDLGWFGKMFLSHTPLVYLAIVIAVVTAIILRHTKVGLHLRAVGEKPATADAAGINVTAYKYVSTLLGGAIAGLGGLYYVVDYIGSWSNDGFGDRGWLAIALVIFAIWKSDLAIPCALLFGGLYIVDMYIPGVGAEQQLIRMLPYAVTVIVLVLISVRKKRETQPPESLGLSYFREDR